MSANRYQAPGSPDLHSSTLCTCRHHPDGSVFEYIEVSNH
jgi:hypothetical protein